MSEGDDARPRLGELRDRDREDLFFLVVLLFSRFLFLLSLERDLLRDLLLGDLDRNRFLIALSEESERVDDRRLPRLRAGDRELE